MLWTVRWRLFVRRGGSARYTFCMGLRGLNMNTRAAGAALNAQVNLEVKAVVKRIQYLLPNARYYF